MVSHVENGKHSPSVVTLEKLLGALGTTLTAFFGADQTAAEGPVFPRESMRLLSDQERSYTIIFPPADNIALQLHDELFQAGQLRPDFQTQAMDIGGYVLSGKLILQLESQPDRILRPGDAFYVPAGTSHRGYSADGEPTRLISFAVSPAGKKKRKRSKQAGPNRNSKGDPG
jgi:transcriptional regulator with XRE-family HTH domain